jgi:hypothetical protein
MPELGDYMVTATGGWFGRKIREITHSGVNHAAIYVGLEYVVEAQPRGAKLTRVSVYPKAIWSAINLTSNQRREIAVSALSLVGTPYNFIDIAAQAVVRVAKWRAPKWALRRLSSAKRLQCAQLVDLAYEMGGVRLFPDGRPEGLVAPSDLLDLINAER